MSESGNPKTGSESQALPPANPRHHGRHLKLIVVIAVLLTTAAVVALAFRPKGAGPAAQLPSVRSAKAFTGPLEETLMLTGQTASRDFVDIKAPIMRGFESGRELILLYLAPSGTRVRSEEYTSELQSR